MCDEAEGWYFQGQADATASAAEEIACLRGALEAAAAFIAVEWERRAFEATTRLGPRGIPAAKAAHDLLDVVLAALNQQEVNT